MRPLRAGDAAGVEALWRRLDAPSRRRFTDLAHLPPDRAGDVALPRPGHTAGITAIAPSGSAGVARYERTAGDAAGFLVFVDASWRRVGLGTLLLRRLALAEAASHAGVRRLGHLRCNAILAAGHRHRPASFYACDQRIWRLGDSSDLYNESRHYLYRRAIAVWTGSSVGTCKDTSHEI